MSIHKITRKHGVSYQVKLRRPDGTQYSKTFKTKREANAFETSEEHSKQKGTWIDLRASSQTFKDLADSWIAQNPQKRQRSLERDLGILKLHLLPSLGQRKILTIKKTDIQDLVNQWSTNGLKPRTIRRHVAVLKAIFKRAIDDERLPKNPADGLRLPKADPVERHPLSADEATRLLQAIDPFFKPLVYIAITTGLRWSELAGLQLQDVILDGPEPQLTVNRGLHNTSTGLRYEKPKSTAGHRIIPLTAIQVDQIKIHLNQTSSHRHEDRDELLFMAPKGGPINYSNFRNRYFGPALTKAGIHQTRIHDLRRTTATMLVANHVDLKTIETMMGHSDVKQTFGAYVMSSEAQARIAIEKLTARLLPGPLKM